MKLRNAMALAAMIITFAACSVDYPGAPGTGFNSGTADYSNYVSIGNSLTAGYQNGGLREVYQQVSYPRMIAAQLGIETFTYNPFPDSGTAGSLWLTGFSTTTGSPILVGSTVSTTPTNSTQSTPYENLGVPGAFLFDFLYATSQTNSWQAVFSGGASTNPLFDAIVRGSTQFTNLKALQPTFVTFHLGNNDVLGYATNGAGTDGAFGGTVPPYTPVNRTDPAFAALSGLETLLGHPITFDSLYARSVDSLVTLASDVVLLNIPNVTAIPYFTAVNKDSVTVNLNPLTRMAIYKSETDVQYVTLTASRYLGSTTFGAGAPAPFGLHPANPLTGNFTLTATEVTNIGNIIAGYNAVISAIATAHDLPVVDLNAFFDNVAAVSGPTGAGYSIGSGIRVKTDFISGGVFSLDGVHPSTLGYGILANEVIKAANAYYGSSVPLVNLSDHYSQ
jgi:lysophospholipase L1-like esterase